LRIEALSPGFDRRGKKIKPCWAIMRVKLREIPARVYLKYTLLQLPGTVFLILLLMVIRHWIAIPAWLFWCIIGLWVAKEAVLFPYVWRAYNGNQKGISRSMIGARGVAKERLAPSGYIQVGGELWRAEKLEPGPAIKAGDFVRVVKMEGLKLYIVADNSESEGRLQRKDS
jgi:membrane protein implicated in regulation of membrane protease activity